MKKTTILGGLTVLLFSLVALLSFTPQPVEPPIFVETLTSSSNSLTVDTVAASETVYWPLTNIIAGRYEYAFSLHADSLSGNPAGTVTLEAQNCWSCDDWYTVGSSLTIDGTSNDGAWTGTAYGVDYRLKLVTTSTTQSNRIEAHSVFKRLPQ